MPCLHLRCRHRQRQGACPLGDPERGLHGLPPRRQPHAEERARRQAPVRGGRNWKQQGNCHPDDGLLPLRRRVLRRFHGQRGAVKKVQRQGVRQDARPEHLRLRGKAVQSGHRTLGQGGPAKREIL